MTSLTDKNSLGLSFVKFFIFTFQSPSLFLSLLASSSSFFFFKNLLGTPHMENTHKYISDLFVAWPIGFKRGDALHAEFMHCQTMKAPERCWPEFPYIGHFHTWLIDMHQNLSESAHSILLYPGHKNASAINFSTTLEPFGILPIDFDDLREQINTIEITSELKPSCNLKFLASRTGKKLPFLPWYGLTEWEQYFLSYY